MKLVPLKTTRQEVLEDGDTLVLPCEVNYYYISNNDQVLEAIEELKPIMLDSKNMVAVDIETNGLDPYLNNIILLQIGIKNNIQYIFDYRRINPELLKPLLESPCWKLGHNLKFDAQFIKIKLGVSLTRLYDTFLAEKVIRGGQFHSGERYSLDVVMKYRLDKELRIINTGIMTTSAIGDKKLALAKKRMQETFINIGNKDPDAAQLAYAAQDVSGETIFKIVEQQIDLLFKEDINSLYDPDAKYISDPEIRANYEKIFKPTLRLWETAKLEFKFLEVVIDIELTGIFFSQEKHKKVMENIINDYKEYRKEFLKLLGKHSPQRTLLGTASVNPDSSKQVLQALNNLKLDLEDTSAEILGAKLRDLTPGTEKYQLVEILLNYRTMSKLVKSYGETLSSQVHPLTGRIHYKIMQILETGRISMSNPNCFSEDTEILTNSGWKYFKNLAEGDLVAQFDHAKELIQFVKPTKTIKYKYQGNLVHIKSTQIDMLVTPDHRCLLKNRKTGEYKVVSAENYPNDYMQLNAAKYVTKNHLKISDSFLRLLVAVQADGYIANGGIDFGFIKERKAKRLKSLLVEDGVTFSEHLSTKGDKPYYKFRILKSDYSKIIFEFLGPKKEFGPWIMELSPKQMNIMADEVFLWDGNSTRLDNYQSKHEINRDWIQIVQILCNRRARGRTYNPGNKWSLSHRVDVTYRNYSMTTNHIKTSVPYDGYVYCVEVPSSFIVVKRNKCVVITGNCQQIPSKITNWKKTGNKEIDEAIKNRDGLRECFISKPGYKLVKYDYDSQELRVIASISRDRNMLQAFKENKNLHCYSATLMYNEDYDDFFKRFKSGDEDAIAKRTAAKTVSFGSLYGSGPSNLSKVLRVTLERAKDILDRFWLAYPEVKKAMNRYSTVSNKVGYSNTVLGRKRYYTDIMDKLKWTYCERSPSVLEERAKEIGLEWLFEKEGIVTYENIEKFREAIMKKYKSVIGRQAGNHHAQGTSADMTKLAAINIWKEFKDKALDAKIVCLIHDEVLVECKEDIAEQCKVIVETKMKEAMNFFCPNIHAAVDGKISEVWSK